jgi:leucyl-tRNA synthetase
MNEITKRARRLRNNSTPAEKDLWQELRKQQLGRVFRRQYPIRFYFNNRKHYFIADFFCKKTSLVIELDGKIHENQKEYDQARDYIIKKLGYKIIRFSNEDIFVHPEYVLKNIKNNLK